MSDYVISGNWEYSGLSKFSGGIDLNSMTASSGDLTLESVAGHLNLNVDFGEFNIRTGGVLAFNIDGLQNVNFVNCASFNVTTATNGGMNFQCNGFNIDSYTGFLVCHGVIGSSYVDDVAIASDAPNFNFARNTATSLFFGNFLCATTMQFSTLDMLAATSAQINSPELNVGNTGTTTALNLGNGACVTKLILQTPAVGTQPLMIDADGTIHV